MNKPSSPVIETATAAAGQREVVVLICRTCKSEGWTEGETRPGEKLAENGVRVIGAEPDESRISARSVECLGNCNRGCTAAILSPGDWYYVFGGLDDGSAEDLLAGARLMGSVAEGPLPWRGRPAILKTGMVARIPPIGD